MVIDGIGYIVLTRGGWLLIILSGFAFLLIGVIIKATFPKTI